MTSVAIILAAATVALGLARWLRMPAVPLLIAGGLTLNVIGAFPADNTVRDVLLLGLMFLVFVVGAELDPRRVSGQARAALSVGLTQFVLLGGVGLGVMRLAGFDWLTSLYVALAVTGSSTLLVVTLLRQREQFFEPFGRLVVGVLLVQDLLIILLLPTLAYATEGPRAVAMGVMGTLGLVVLAGVVSRWIAPWLVLTLKLEQENLLLTVLAILFLFVGIAHWFALPLVTGAFLAGLALSRFPLRGLVRGQVTSLADFFLAMFFVALGASVTFPGPRQLLVDGLLVAAIVVVAPPLAMLIARYIGMTTRTSIEAGHLLANCGEFGIVVALIGVQQGHVGENILAVIVLVSVATMALTPFLARDTVTWTLMHWLARLRRHPVGRYRNHVLVLGCSERMTDVVRRIVENGHTVVVVDDDALAVERARRAGAFALRGDGADLRMLRLSQAQHASLVISTMRRLQDSLRVLQHVSRPKVLVRVFSDAEAKRITPTGASVIVEADAGAAQFLAWFNQQFARLDHAADGKATTSARS